jgi:hypothetical protein
MILRSWLPFAIRAAMQELYVCLNGPQVHNLCLVEALRFCERQIVQNRHNQRVTGGKRPTRWLG